MHHRFPELLLTSVSAPPTGDGFYYPSLDDTEQVLTDDQAELKGAEQDLEHGRFQDCEETCMRLLSASNDADVQRLLLHCFRCSGRAHFAWKAAEDQLERFAAQQRMDAKAKMKLSMAESCLAQGQDAKALHLAKEVYQDFRSLDLPSFEGLALLIMAAATNNAKKAEDWSCEAIEAFQIDGHSHGLGRALLQLASSASARQKAATKALETFKFCGDERWQAFTLQKMALWFLEEDNPLMAAQHAEAAVHLLHNGMTLQREAELSEVCCAAYRSLGQPEVGLRSIRSCWSRARKKEDRRIEAHMLYASIKANQAALWPNDKEKALQSALKTAENSREIFQELGDRKMELAALLATSQLYLEGSKLQEALQTAQEAVALAQDAEDEELSAAALMLSGVRLAREEFVAAKQALDMPIEASAKSRRYLVKMKMQAAKVSIEAKDYDSAERMLEKASALYHLEGDWKGKASAYLMLARVQLERGKEDDASRAMEHASKASELSRDAGDRLQEAHALLHLSEAGRQCVLSLSNQNSRLCNQAAVPAMQAARDALTIAEHFDEDVLRAHAHLRLADLQVLSETLLEAAISNASQAAELFVEATKRGDCAYSKDVLLAYAYSKEVQGMATYRWQHRTKASAEQAEEAAHEAKVALEQAKAAYEQAEVFQASRRCQDYLKEMGMKATSVSQEAKMEPKAMDTYKQWQPKMPAPLESKKLEKKNREVQDFSKFEGEALVMMKLKSIVEDLGGDEGIEMDDPFMSAGLNSRAAVQLRSELEQAFGPEIQYPSTLAFDHPNIRSMSSWLSQHIPG